MNIVKSVLALLLLASVANAQTSVSSFPYYYDWKSPAPFTTSDGSTYVGGDGHWGTYSAGTIPQWTTNNSGWVETNLRGNVNTLFVSIDAKLRSFSGAEVFTFDALRAGSTTGTLTVYANSTVILTLNIESDLLTGTWRHFSAPLPAELGNSLFTVSIVTNSDKDVSIDNTGISGGSLPITLAWLKLNLSGQFPELTWSTLSEINNYGFYVQRSDDLNNWADLVSTFQPGQGTTVVQQFYAVTDTSRPVARYYRLRQIDLDGTSHYSETVSVTAAVEPAPVAREFALSQNYPNPFNPVTTIKYTVGVAGGKLQVASEAGGEGRGSGGGMTRLVVYDVLGRQVATLVNEEKAPGSYEVRFDGSGLASGVYIYRLTAGSFTDTKRMMLLK